MAASRPFVTRSASARAALGRSLREHIPRKSHGVWQAPADRFDPLVRLESVAKGRLPFLAPLRNAKLADTAFTFFRGGAAIMAGDLSRTPVTGLTVQVCGDAHCLNFGGFASPERNLIFDLNDFDETLRGPWEWDLKRLVTSFVLAARDIGLSESQASTATTACARAYRRRMRDLALLPSLTVWYTRLDAAEILDAARSIASKAERTRIKEEAVRGSLHAAFEKLTIDVNGDRRLIDRDPDLFHSAETEKTGFDVEAILREYASTLAPDVRVLFDRYSLLDHAIKVVGVGSVGTRCAIALYMADDHDPLILQVKEAVPSVLEAFIGVSECGNSGERVVRGQRLMQAASDVFLGWASSGEHDFYVRQFRDMKATANLDGASADELVEYAEFCAKALAAAHARSGDPAAISGYIGESHGLDKALTRFAFAYADQVNRDYALFADAVVKGVVEAA
jgi:uncharacterized protein (DUF2252 family)